MLTISPASAQLQWGSTGAGGDGSWDSTTLDWFDGSSNVVWTPGGQAVFGGTAGTVTLTGNQLASQLTFTSPGYTLAGSFNIDAPNSALTIETDANATINTSLGSSQTTLTKTGTGTLTFDGTLFSFGHVAIQSGELIFNSSTVPAAASYSLANTAGTTLTLGGKTIFLMNGLSGGGTSGGLVRPMAGSSPLSLILDNTGSTTFGGTLADNGSSTLSLLMEATGTQTLTGANTYSGVTEDIQGKLVLSGAGSILKTSSLQISDNVVLDNTTTNSTNRLSDTANFQLGKATFTFLGNSSSSSSETVGLLAVADAGQIVVTDGQGQSAQMTFTGIQNFGGSVNFSGTGTSQITGATNTNGIIGAFATYGGTDWATLDSSNNVVAYTGYAANIATPGTTANVLVNATGGTVAFLPQTTIDSLKVDTVSNTTLMLSSPLQLQSGGLLVTGSANLVISGGSITANGPSLYLYDSSTVNLNSPLTGNGVAFFKEGSGDLILGGTHTYSGITLVQNGTLTIASAATLSRTSSVSVSKGATLQVDGSINSSAQIHVNSGTLNGKGSVGGVTVETGTLTAGDNGTTTGTLTTEQLTMQNSTLALRIDPGTKSADKIAVLGAITLQSLQLSLSILGPDEALAYGTKLTLMSYFGTDGGISTPFVINGTQVADGGTFQLGDNEFRIFYQDDTSPTTLAIDVEAIPEPTTEAMLFLGLLGLCLTQRHRRAKKKNET